MVSVSRRNRNWSRIGCHVGSSRQCLLPSQGTESSIYRSTPRPSMVSTTAFSVRLCGFRASWNPPPLPIFERTILPLVRRWKTCLTNGRSPVVLSLTAWAETPLLRAFISKFDERFDGQSTGSSHEHGDNLVDSLITLSSFAADNQSKRAVAELVIRRGVAYLAARATRPLQAPEFYIQSPQAPLRPIAWIAPRPCLGVPCSRAPICLDMRIVSFRFPRRN